MSKCCVINNRISCAKKFDYEPVKVTENPNDYD